MKNFLCALVPAAAIAALTNSLQAQPEAHYIPGMEGIKGGSLPPPGVYFRDYNMAYFGEWANIPEGGFGFTQNRSETSYAIIPRVIWITDAKFLGGNVGVDGFVPLVNRSASYKVSRSPGDLKWDVSAPGDPFAEGTLSWHFKQLDLVTGAGEWIPTGQSATPADPGFGFWTTMLTLGATWHPDTEKTWAISALNRYEFNSENHYNRGTPGEAWTLEGAISKSLTKTVELGVVGYYQRRITGSEGERYVVVQHYYPYSSVAAIGPEITATIPRHALSLSLRYTDEFLANNRLQGQTVTLTLTKAF